MKVRMDQVKPLRFIEDGNEMTVGYSNRGEPFRQGVEFQFDRCGGPVIWVLLERQEVEVLRDKLNQFLAAK